MGKKVKDIGLLGGWVDEMLYRLEQYVEFRADYE